MSETLRRLYNRIDLLFDSRAIARESRFSSDGGASGESRTAAQALAFVLPHVRRFDGGAGLKSIVSQQGVRPDGTSAHWEFFFDLPGRRARIIAEWRLAWDEAHDAFGSASVDFLVKPFPPADSPIRQAVREGKLLHRQMAGMWKQEHQRTARLPIRFRDSDLAFADFRNQGLDASQTEFSLSTGRSPQGNLCWIAQARDTTYYAALTILKAG
jgi:hypothetical protein